MPKKRIKYKNDESFLCFCSRVTNKTFQDKVNSNDFMNLENLCDQLNLAKKCCACLPKIEDQFFNLEGKKVRLIILLINIINFQLKK